MSEKKIALKNGKYWLKCNDMLTIIYQIINKLISKWFVIFIINQVGICV